MDRDIDKFNVIYDYVTTNVAYDYTYSKYDAYNALFNTAQFVRTMRF
ncbi:hypothetical protein [Holdemania massiliensis]|nr:hypothetical protein [Holdemania massiliensis]